jgi:hypothetical protein
MLKEKKEQIKKEKYEKRKQKHEFKQHFFVDAKQVFGSDDISTILALKWKRTKHFVKRFFNKNFPNEWTTRATCKCGKSFKTKSGLNGHKSFCDLINDKEMKININKDYDQLMSIKQISQNIKFLLILLVY